VSAIEEQTGHPRRVRRPEHEVVDEELRAAGEEVGERLPAPLGLERVAHLDRNPGKLSALPRQLVAAARELLLLREQSLPLCLPLLLRADSV
jgi:hypothetical protein